MFKSKYLTPEQIEARYAVAKGFIEQELLDCHLTRMINEDPNAMAMNDQREAHFRGISNALDLDFRATIAARGQVPPAEDRARAMVDAAAGSPAMDSRNEDERQDIATPEEP